MFLTRLFEKMRLAALLMNRFLAALEPSADSANISSPVTRKEYHTMKIMMVTIC